MVVLEELINESNTLNKTKLPGRMKYYLIFILSILYITNSFSQNFKGRITDKTGEALYGSSVYIKSVNQGLVCNEEGYYQTTLPVGEYLVEYKCLGFRQIEIVVRIESNEVTIMNIMMEETPFDLKEVTVSRQEDPAYPIMRKAIEKAPLYAGAANSYIADVYIKGSGEILKVASLVDKLAKNAEGIKLSELKNQIFVQESFSEIEFTSPDKYKQTVKAFSSSIPDDFDSKDALPVMRTSLYMPKDGMFVSPLNPKAFSYYRFRYEGFIEDNGVTVNKIKVELKMKDPILYSGYIYIADDTWHIHSAKLACNVYGVREDYTITYQELGQNVYLPITYVIATDIDIFGTKMVFDYYASLTYKDLIVNEDIVKELEEQKKPKKREFEIKRDTLYQTKSDSLATRRDSAYWANIRVIPLDSREIGSFVKKDSIQHHIDSVRKDHKDPDFSFFDILDGGKIGNDSTKFIFRFDGLLRAAPEYNFVDGVWLGQKFRLETKLKKHTKLEIAPYAYYAYSRKRMIAGGDIKLTYAPMRLGELHISGGSTSEDFNPNGIHRLNNASSSLVKGKNYNYFYQKDFVSLVNHIDLANGLTLNMGFEIAKRSGLSNHTSYTWGRKRDITPNIFSDDRFDRTVYGIGLSYTPYAYYRLKDGKKEYVRFTSPTFYIQFSEAFSGWQTNNSKYRKLSGGLQHNVKLSEFSRFLYSAEGGGFLGKKDQMHFADFHHFNTSNVLVNLKSPFTSFMLLDNYTASTNNYWIKGEFNYNSNYILLKRLPFLQGKLFTESLHLKTLYTSEMKPYSEIGYSINITGLLNFGTFASFKKTKYQDFGIRVLFDLESTKRAFR